jgi:heme exporter protein C
MALTKQATGIASSTEERTDDVDRGSPARLPIAASLILGGLSCIGMLASIWLIFFYTPIDALQGVTQRIFYFHVPTAWVGMFAFVVMTIAGIVYLIKPDERLDWIARASGEIGAVFLTFLLITGSLWGKPIWGAWWVWDPKLTAALILWFMFIGYLMLRSYMGRTPESARIGAVWSVVGVIDVPIIYFSVLWWRGQHPGPQITSDGGLPPAAVLTLMVSLATFTLLYCFLMVLVYQLQHLQTQAQRLRAIVE